MKKQIEYLIYGLVHPIYNKICYIGMTRQGLRKRLSQHMKPSNSNGSIVAKSAKRLSEKGLRFEIILIHKCESQKDMEAKEIYYIDKYQKEGYKLYNIQPGGKHCDNSNNADSIQKQKDTFQKNKKAGKHKFISGNNCVHSKLTEESVLEIYSLIKKGYTNFEISQIFTEVKVSALKSVRNGLTWKWLWDRHFTTPIQSIKSNPTGLKSYQKVRVVQWLDQGYSHLRIAKLLKMQSSDVKRIKEEKLWQPVWEFYKNYVKAPLVSNN